MPSALQIQEFEGVSWVGIVAFQMAGIMRRMLPDLPWISAFPQLNVRLYVERDGKPGVWFLSVDATNPLAVWAGRRFFHLPYHRAQIDLILEEERVRYKSDRIDRESAVGFTATYEPSSAVYETKPGCLEHWLTERYCLYSQTSDGSLYRTEIDHRPWPLQKAVADITRNTMVDLHNLRLEGPPSHLHFSRHLDVFVWPPECVG